MSERDFIYWLRGFMESVGNSNKLTESQVKLIKEHLEKLFATPPMTLPDACSVDLDKLIC